jgi:hypothetical protein
MGVNLQAELRDGRLARDAHPPPFFGQVRFVTLGYFREEPSADPGCCQSDRSRRDRGTIEPRPFDLQKRNTQERRGKGPTTTGTKGTEMMNARSWVLLLAALTPLTTPAAIYADDADPFAEGAVWSGSRFFRIPKNAKDAQTWTLKVTQRTGNKFKGEVTLFRGKGRDETYKVEGTATSKNGGPVRFSSEKKGFFQQHFHGKLNNNQFAGVFVGFGFDGTKVEGTAILDPKN